LFIWAYAFLAICGLSALQSSAANPKKTSHTGDKKQQSHLRELELRKSRITDLFCPRVVTHQSQHSNLIEIVHHSKDADLSLKVNELASSLVTPMQNELARYKDLRSRAEANSLSLSEFNLAATKLARKAGLENRDYNPDTYRNDSLFEHPILRSKYFKDAEKKSFSEEIIRLKKLREEIRSQAKTHAQELRDLGFPIIQQAHEDVHLNPGTVLQPLNNEWPMRLREKDFRNFIEALHQEKPLQLTRLNSQDGALKELVQIEGEKALKIAVDDTGAYFIKGIKESAYLPLCNGIPIKKAASHTSAESLVKRFIDTGRISISTEECEELKKTNPDKAPNEQLAEEFLKALQSTARNSTEILIPTQGMSSDFKNTIKKASTPVAKIEKNAEEINQVLAMRINELDVKEAELREKAAKQESESKDYFDLALDWSLDDLLSGFSPGTTSFVEELKQKYPLVVKADIGNLLSVIEAREAHAVNAKELEIGRLLAQGLIPLNAAARYSHSRLSSFYLGEKDLEKKHELSFEFSTNPTNENIEVYPSEYSCPSPYFSKRKKDEIYTWTGKRLSLDPIFIIDKKNAISITQKENRLYEEEIKSVIYYFQCPEEN